MLGNLSAEDLIERDINNYINECSVRIDFHTKNAILANNYSQMFSILSTILSAGSGLSMVIFGSSQNYSNETIVITGGVLSFTSIIVQKIHTSYNFNLLSSQHFFVADLFLDIKHSFTL